MSRDRTLRHLHQPKRMGRVLHPKVETCFEGTRTNLSTEPLTNHSASISLPWLTEGRHISWLLTGLGRHTLTGTRHLVEKEDPRSAYSRLAPLPAGWKITPDGLGECALQPRYRRVVFASAATSPARCEEPNAKQHPPRVDRPGPLMLRLQSILLVLVDVCKELVAQLCADPRAIAVAYGSL